MARNALPTIIPQARSLSNCSGLLMDMKPQSHSWLGEFPDLVMATSPIKAPCEPQSNPPASRAPGSHPHDAWPWIEPESPELSKTIPSGLGSAPAGNDRSRSLDSRRLRIVSKTTASTIPIKRMDVRLIDF